MLRSFIIALLLPISALSFSFPGSLNAAKLTSPPLAFKPTPKHLAVATIAVSQPFIAIAEEVDNYEYGAVDAPIGIAWGVGVLAILTSLLPLALKGGEEALDDMRENEGYSFGKGRDMLGSKRGRKK
mmetsp:Transcript_10335/g.21260  ORF Transcript_10335/g.21260 Transcript_10335/m.21260 type:complete len:127 (-) Transcript_10335:103-483(-)